MIKYHRFHVKIDRKLLAAIDKRAISSCVSRSTYVNRALGRMTELVNEFDLHPIEHIFIKDGVNFSCDVFIDIKESMFERLRYLHYRFGTFSIGSVLRCILRFFLIKCEKSIFKLIRMVTEFNKDVLRCYSNIRSHMVDENIKTTRCIHINTNYRIHFLAGYT